ncbi:MAG: SGNH/GDSL hydrolase family protein [Oscillospiraceae bacterium]|nr:SGNH/GDSL hydrolase family protein [Oscillospiraceae bacterium]
MEKTIKTYQSLNKLAAASGTVIFGGAEDRLIPLGELKDTFDLQDTYYNRSLPELYLDNAIDLYDRCVAPLVPQDLYLHIGGADKGLFTDNAAQFDLKYSQLVRHIRSVNKKCNIAIISLKNPDADAIITEINKHLEVIAQNEGCAFCDISKIQVWNPKQTKEVVSFLYAIGFVRPLKQKRPLQDIAKILFCYEPTYIV